MLALSIASAMAGAAGQRSQQKAQEAANKQQYNNAVTARNANLVQTEIQARQASDAAGQKIMENNMKAQDALSTAQVSAAESGVSGLSVDALLSDLAGKRDRYNTGVQTNLDNDIQAINNDRENANIRANNVIASLKPATPPDYLGAALKIGTAGVNYWDETVKAREKAQMQAKDQTQTG
jgi:hypothetical protein